MAQANVYSLNVVGYINITVHHGLNLLTAPLQNADTSNSINSVLHNATPAFDSQGSTGSFVQAWNPTAQGFAPARLAGGDGFWYDDTFTTQVTDPIAPGQGFFINNAGGDTVLTLVGTVVNQSSYPINTLVGFYGNVLPIAEDVALNGFPIASSSFIQTFNSGTQSYDAALQGVSAADNVGFPTGDFYDDTFSTIIPFVPGVGVGFLYGNPAGSPAAAWTQSFSVGN
jgi:hypothetical protein